MKLDTSEYPLGSKKRAVAQISGGDLLKGLKTATTGKLKLQELSKEIDLAVQKLYKSGNIGTILSAYYEYGSLTNLSVDELLNKMFELKDYPSFLKQVYRFGRYKGFEEKIEKCLSWHEERHLPDAYAWRLKIGKLIEQEKMKEKAQDLQLQVLDEEKSLTTNKDIFLELKPIILKSTEKEPPPTDEMPKEEYYLSQVSKNKMEKANGLHSKTLNILSQTLQQHNYIVRETNLIDAYTIINGEKVIFEVKSISEENEREQIRKAISQLYEYRFLYSLFDAVLCVVFSQKPFSQWLIDYLLKDRQIKVLWIENEKIAGESLVDLLKQN